MTASCPEILQEVPIGKEVWEKPPKAVLCAYSDENPSRGFQAVCKVESCPAEAYCTRRVFVVNMGGFGNVIEGIYSKRPA